MVDEAGKNGSPTDEPVDLADKGADIVGPTTWSGHLACNPQCGQLLVLSYGDHLYVCTSNV